MSPYNSTFNGKKTVAYASRSLGTKYLLQNHLKKCMLKLLSLYDEEAFVHIILN